MSSFVWGWRAAYSDSFSQAGGGKWTVVIVSKLRPLICCRSGDANFVGSGKRAMKNMDMSPPIFLWLSSGLRRLVWALDDVGEIDILYGDIFDESVVGNQQ